MLEQAQEVSAQPSPLIGTIRSHLEEGALRDAIRLVMPLHVSAQAQVLVNLESDLQRLLFSGLDHETAGALLSYIDPDQGGQLVSGVDPYVVALWLDQTEAKAATKILRRLSVPVAKEALKGMSQADVVVQLLEHPDDSAGGIATSEFVAFKEWMTAAEALSWLRKARPEPRTTDQVFVVDIWNRVCGFTSLSELLLADPGIAIRDVMRQEVIYVAPGTGREECAKLMKHHNLSSLPITDQSGTILGAVHLKDVVGSMEDKASRQMYRVASRSDPEGLTTPFAASIRNRLPWLVFNLLTIVLGVGVIAMFESTIAKVVTVAALMTVVADQGTVGGSQTIALMVRGLALGEISLRDTKQALIKEIALGLINGLILGVIVGIAALLWKGSWVLGLALGLAMVGDMVLAGLSGVIIPLGLKLFRIDPAIASVVVASTVTDVCGFLFFLGLVTLMLPLL